MVAVFLEFDYRPWCPRIILGMEVYKATIPYSIDAEPNIYFSFGIMVNSDYQPVNGFYIDEISVSAAQAPLITGISLNGTNLTINGTNGLTGIPLHFALEHGSFAAASPVDGWYRRETHLPDRPAALRPPSIRPARRPFIASVCRKTMQ